MYGIFTHIYHKNQPTGGKYTARPMDHMGLGLPLFGPYGLFEGTLSSIGKKNGIRHIVASCFPPKETHVVTLPEAKIFHLKMDGWNTILSFWGPAYFQGRTVSFREGVNGHVMFTFFECCLVIQKIGQSSQQLLHPTKRSVHIKTKILQ